MDKEGLVLADWSGDAGGWECCGAYVPASVEGALAQEGLRGDNEDGETGSAGLSLVRRINAVRFKGWGMCILSMPKRSGATEDSEEREQLSRRSKHV